MQKTLKEIAKFIEGEIIGNDKVQITGAAGIKEAQVGDITFLSNPKYLPFLEKTNASAVITSRQIDKAPVSIIRTENPSLAFAKAISLFKPEDTSHPKGIHQSVLFGKDVLLGKNVNIGPYVVIEDGVAIGDNTIIYSGTYIAHHSEIGNNVLIYPNVSIREHVKIGSRVVIQSGVVIGSEGFGFVTIDGKHHRIPQIGEVLIEDDVEIGANVTIDRARFNKTIIGKGTKIDNLVQIAHNVVIGENCFIISLTGLSGSSSIGNNVTIAGQAGVAGHVHIGDGTIVAGRAGVTKSIPENSFVSGYPAKPHEVAKNIHACVQNLPRLYEQVKELKKELQSIKEQQKNG